MDVQVAALLFLAQGVDRQLVVVRERAPVLVFFGVADGGERVVPNKLRRPLHHVSLHVCTRRLLPSGLNLGISRVLSSWGLLAQEDVLVLKPSLRRFVLPKVHARHFLFQRLVGIVALRPRGLLLLDENFVNMTDALFSTHFLPHFKWVDVVNRFRGVTADTWCSLRFLSVVEDLVNISVAAWNFLFPHCLEPTNLVKFLAIVG
jgi:hypothetical protein